MPKVDLVKLKNEAQKMLQKGKLDKALELYLDLEKNSPGDPKVPHKVAEIYHKLGKKAEAINKYKDAAQSYLDRGFLVQAIALNKVILDIDPKEPEAKARLDELINKRAGAASKISPARKAPEPTKPAAPAPGRAAPSPPHAEEAEEETAAAAPVEPDFGTIELPEEDESPPPEEPDLSEKSEFEQMPAEAALEALEMPAAAPAPAEDTIEPLPVESEPEASGPERTPLFSDLEPAEFKRVFELLRTVTIPAGIAVCREGDKGDSIFIIAEGRVKITRKDAQGQERQVAALGPTEFFGEFGYFANATRQATVKAESKTRLLEISKAQMDQVVKEFPRVREVLLQFYRERVLDNLLAFTPIFQTLGQEDRRQLANLFTPVTFAPGAVIVKEGNPGDSMFIIKSGEVEVTTVSPLNQQRMVLAKLHCGDFFGEVSLIKKKPRTATITALTPVEAMELTRNNYEALTRHHPEITRLLEETIEKRVEETIQVVTGHSDIALV